MLWLARLTGQQAGRRITDSEFCWRGLSGSKSDILTAYPPQLSHGYGSEPCRALLTSPRRSETHPAGNPRSSNSLLDSGTARRHDQASRGPNLR
jgi:hypothetical protein